MWVGLLKGLVSLAARVAGVVEKRQLMDAGAAKATLRGLRDAQSIIDRARRARQSVDDDDIMRDQYNRDIPRSDREDDL
jgi:hypothetical protein